MKKIVVLILVFIMVLTTFGCNKSDINADSESKDSSSSEKNSTKKAEKELVSDEEETTTVSKNYIVLQATDTNLIVADIGEDGKAIESMQYSVPNWFHPSTEIEVGYEITIKHNNIVLETFPMMFAEIYTMEYYDKDTGLGVTVIAD